MMSLGPIIDHPKNRKNSQSVFFCSRSVCYCLYLNDLVLAQALFYRIYWRLFALIKSRNTRPTVVVQMSLFIYRTLPIYVDPNDTSSTVDPDVELN